MFAEHKWVAMVETGMENGSESGGEVDFQSVGKVEWVVGDLLEGWMTKFGNGVTEIGRWIHG